MAFLPECWKESNPTPQLCACTPVKVTTCQQSSPQSQHLKGLTNFCDTSRPPDGLVKTANWLSHQQGVPQDTDTRGWSLACISWSTHCLFSPHSGITDILFINTLCRNILKTSAPREASCTTQCQACSVAQIVRLDGNGRRKTISIFLISSTTFDFFTFNLDSNNFCFVTGSYSIGQASLKFVI